MGGVSSNIDLQQVMDASKIGMNFMLGNRNIFFRKTILHSFSKHRVKKVGRVPLLLMQEFLALPHRKDRAVGFFHCDPSYHKGANRTFLQHLKWFLVLALAITTGKSTPQEGKKIAANKNGVIVDSVAAKFYKTMRGFHQLVELGYSKMWKNEGTGAKVPFPAAFKSPMSYLHCMIRNFVKR